MSVSKPRRYRVAGAQIDVTFDVAANKKKIVKYIRRASKAEVDFLVFPE